MENKTQFFSAPIQFFCATQETEKMQKRRTDDSSASAAKRRLVLTTAEEEDNEHELCGVELPPLRPPPLPPVERIKEYYMEWILYAHEVLKQAEAGRVYLYEVLEPRRERIAAGLPAEQECADNIRKRAKLPSEWIDESFRTEDWEPAILCVACDSDDTSWMRLRGTCITACKRCIAKLKEHGTPVLPDGAPIPVTSTTTGGVKRPAAFPPKRRSGATAMPPESVVVKL